MLSQKLDKPALAKAGVQGTNNTASGVWADSAYRSKANEAKLAERDLKSHIH